MKCINCKTVMDGWIEIICAICKCDSDVVISLSDVKTYYGLTQEELVKGMLLKITYIGGTKYLRSQVHGLAGKICRKLKDDDVKKSAYIKMDNYYKEKKVLKNKRVTSLETIRSICLDLLKKCDVQMLPEIEEYLDGLIEDDESEDYDEFHRAIMITNDVYELYKEMSKKLNSKKELDDLIKKNFDCKYQEFAMIHRAYEECIENCTLTVDEAFNKIAFVVNRKKALDTLIDENINGLYLEQAYNNDIYDAYMKDEPKDDFESGRNPIFYEFNILTTVEAFDAIKTKINLSISKDGRLKELKGLLRKNKILLTNAKSTEVYADFIDKCSGTAQDAICKIKNELEKRKRISDFDNLVKGDWRLRNDMKQKKFYKDCIDFKITWTEAIIEFDIFLEVKEQEAKVKERMVEIEYRVDNCWLSEFEQLPIYKQYISTGQPKISIVLEAIDEYRKKLLNISQKWKQWLVSNPYHGYYKENLRIDKSLFDLCDSQDAVLHIKNNSNIERRYIHVRCDQLNLEHYTETVFEDNIMTITKKQGVIY